MNKKIIIVFLLGALVGSLSTHTILTEEHHHGSAHPIGYADSEDEVHVHSDLLVHIAGQTLDLSADKYQTTSMQELHESIHLHDNHGGVVHRHAHDITLGEFFNSLGLDLSNTCITNDTGEEFCTNETDELLVLVNGTRIENPAEYVNQEEDQIIVYYGDPTDTETITALQNQVTDEACIYSGTCPERGTPPPEACGITCEL